MKYLFAPLLASLFLAACSPKSPEVPSYEFTAYKGATIIDGNGGAPIQNGVMIIKEGRITAIGSSESVSIPDKTEIIDVTGKFIMPGIINTHGHVGDSKGPDGGFYSTENIVDNLTIYARYGVTTVISLGGDRHEAVPIRAQSDTSCTQHARLYIAGQILAGETTQEVLAIADSNHHMGVDFMKIRVDDNLGTAKKISEATYRSAIQKAHDLGYKVATHMYYLDDARKLAEAGTDMMAHSVRDKQVDQSFIDLMKSKHICYSPTLTRELSTFVYGDTAKFFNDPFFKKEFGKMNVNPLLDPAKQEQVRNSKSAITYKKQLPVAMANLKTLYDNGVPVVFGTDSGVPARFIGYFEHLEMQMMAEAGLTPMQIIQSASKTAAECMGLKDLGSLDTGHWADFVILEADPLADITNTRKISKVVISGIPVVD